MFVLFISLQARAREIDEIRDKQEGLRVGKKVR